MWLVGDEGTPRDSFHYSIGVHGWMVVLLVTIVKQKRAETRNVTHTTEEGPGNQFMVSGRYTGPSCTLPTAPVSHPALLRDLDISRLFLILQHPE